MGACEYRGGSVTQGQFFPLTVRPLPTPRDWQVSAKESLRKEMQAHRTANVRPAVIVAAPTGSGKTIFALDMIQSSLEKGNRCIFVVDRTTLINQTSARADAHGIDHGIIQAKNPRFDLRKPFQIASIQTLGRRGIPPGFDLVIIDEAHTQYATTKWLIDSGAFIVGLTATPCTKGLGGSYTSIINATTMHAQVERGEQAKMRVISCQRIDMSKAKTVDGEWSAHDVEVGGKVIVGDVVAEYAKHVGGEKSIFFGGTIAHCEDAAKNFTAAGFKAHCFTSDTDDEERERILSEFVKPDSKIRILCSVEALAKGFDVPDITCVMDARPLKKSLAAWLQMIGRGGRSHTGKEQFTLLDFSGNCVRFADDYAQIFFDGFPDLKTATELEKKKRKEVKKDDKGSKCPKCGYTPCGKVCVSCGHRRVGRNEVTALAGSGKESDIFKGAKAPAKDAADLWAQIATYVKKYGKPETANQRAHYLFRDLSRGMRTPKVDVHSVPDVPTSSKVLGLIKSRNIANAWVIKRTAA